MNRELPAKDIAELVRICLLSNANHENIGLEISAKSDGLQCNARSIRHYVDQARTKSHIIPDNKTIIRYIFWGQVQKASLLGITATDGFKLSDSRQEEVLEAFETANPNFLKKLPHDKKKETIKWATQALKLEDFTTWSEPDSNFLDAVVAKSVPFDFANCYQEMLIYGRSISKKFTATQVEQRIAYNNSKFPSYWTWEMRLCFKEYHDKNIRKPDTPVTALETDMMNRFPGYPFDAEVIREAKTEYEKAKRENKIDQWVGEKPDTSLELSSDHPAVPSSGAPSRERSELLLPSLSGAPQAQPLSYPVPVSVFDPLYNQSASATGVSESFQNLSVSAASGPQGGYLATAEGLLTGTASMNQPRVRSRNVPPPRRHATEDPATEDPATEDKTSQSNKRQKQSGTTKQTNTPKPSGTANKKNKKK